MSKKIKVADTKSKLNQIAQAAQDAEQAPAPQPDPQQTPASCPTCGAMAKHMDPEKLSKFMQNNPFKK